jgi:heme-degrading monooxygenase HmoA
MIARIWKGRTSLEKYEDYTRFLLEKAKPDYKSVPGNIGFHFLRKADQVFGYFELITFWDSVESIKRFAGDNYQKAKYYPEDEQYLIDFEEHVEHFEVFDSHLLDRT